MPGGEEAWDNTGQTGSPCGWGTDSKGAVLPKEAGNMSGDAVKPHWSLDLTLAAMKGWHGVDCGHVDVTPLMCFRAGSVWCCVEKESEGSFRCWAGGHWDIPDDTGWQRRAAERWGSWEEPTPLEETTPVRVRSAAYEAKGKGHRANACRVWDPS